MKYRVPQGQPCLRCPLGINVAQLYTSSGCAEEIASKDNEMKENPSAWQGREAPASCGGLMRERWRWGGQGVSQGSLQRQELLFR